MPDHLSIKLPLLSLSQSPPQDSAGVAPEQHPFALKEHYMAQLRQYQTEKSQNDSEYLAKVERLLSPAELNQLCCRSCGYSLYRTEESEFLAGLSRLSLDDHEEGTGIEKEKEKGNENKETEKEKEKKESEKETDKNRTASERIKQVFSLPSPYWLEMADCWTCGGCCSFQQFPRGEIKALPFACFVADTFIMLHSSQLDFTLTHPEQKVLQVCKLTTASFS